MKNITQIILHRRC